MEKSSRGTNDDGPVSGARGPPAEAGSSGGAAGPALGWAASSSTAPDGFFGEGFGEGRPLFGGGGLAVTALACTAVAASDLGGGITRGALRAAALRMAAGLGGTRL